MKKMTKFRTSIVLGTIVSLLLIIFVSCSTSDIGLEEQQKQLPLNQNTDETPVVEEIKEPTPKTDEQKDLVLRKNLDEFGLKYARYSTMFRNKVTRNKVERNKVDYEKLQQLLQENANSNNRVDLENAFEKSGVKNSVEVVDVLFKMTNLINNFRNDNPDFVKYSQAEMQNLLTIAFTNGFEQREREKELSYLKKSSKITDDTKPKTPKQKAEEQAKCDKKKKEDEKEDNEENNKCNGVNSAVAIAASFVGTPAAGVESWILGSVGCMANNAYNIIQRESEYEDCESKI